MTQNLFRTCHQTQIFGLPDWFFESGIKFWFRGVFFCVRIPPRDVLTHAIILHFTVTNYETENITTQVLCLLPAVGSTMRSLVHFEPSAVHPSKPTKLRIVDSTRTAKKRSHSIWMATMTKKTFAIDCHSSFFKFGNHSKSIEHNCHRDNRFQVSFLENIPAVIAFHIIICLDCLVPFLRLLG